MSLKRIRFEDNPLQVELNPVQAPVQAVLNPAQAVLNQDDLSFFDILATVGADKLSKDPVLSQLTLPMSYTIHEPCGFGSHADAVMMQQSFKGWLQTTHEMYHAALRANRPCVESPVITVPPAATVTVLPQPSNFDVLCDRVAQLPPFDKLQILKMDDGSIIMQVIAKMLDGRSVDAVITIKNGVFSECLVETKPEQIKLNVPWVPTKQNSKLRAQLITITQEAATFDVTINPATSGDGYVGIHRYPGVGGIVCITSSEVSKFSFQPSLHLRLDAPNPTLAIVKTPNSPFDGVLKTFKKVVGGFEIEGKVIPSGKVLLLDKLLSTFLNSKL